MKGYYSILQYCPDASRAEVANIGVLLFCPESHFLDIRIANGNDRPRRVFQVSGDALDDLDLAKEMFERRIRNEAKNIRKLEHLEHFIATRANDLLLTPARNLRVTEPEKDLVDLYRELVGGRARGEAVEQSGRGVSLRRQLRHIFEDDELKDKVMPNPTVHLKYGRPFGADYAFFNGKASFIVAQTVHIDPERNIRDAEHLAYRGSQMLKHGVLGKEAELVVPLPDVPHQLADSAKQMKEILLDAQVTLYDTANLDELTERIEREAHIVSPRDKIGL